MDTTSSGSARHAANKALLASFFILGMGLFAPVASIWQSMDYLNAQFEAYYPSRLMSTGYNMMYMLLIFALFKWGAGLWPSKHSRMLTGYLLYVAALATPPAVDQILMGYLQLDGSTAAVRGALACWGTAAAVAGAADAMISSVIYGEAAAAGLKYTHAFMAGKAASGVVMATLRCISKLAMPHTKQGLQHSTGIYSAAAALLVLLCAGIVAWVLPRMQQTMAELRQHSGVTVEQTLQEIDLAVAKAHATSHTAHSGPARRRHLATCSTCPTMSAASRHDSSEFSSTPDCERQPSQLSRNSYPPDKPRHMRSHRLHVSIPEGLIPHGAQYSLPEVMLSAMAHSREQQQQQGQDGDRSQLQYESGAGHSRSSLETLQREGSWVLHIPASRTTYGDAVIVNAVGSRTSSQSTFSCSGSSSSYCGELRCCSSSACCGIGEACALEQAASSSSSSGSSDTQSCFADEQMPSAACVAVAAGGMTAQHKLKKSPFGYEKAVLQGDKKQQQALPVLQKKSIFAPSSNQPPSVWRAVKLIYPYQIAAFIPPLITATILPMCMSSQVGQSRALGSWYIQVLVVAIQLGSFVGSALIPVSHPKYPRTTLLSAACAMVLFVAGFAIALRRGLFAIGFIPLAFVMQMYAGYLTTSVFCLAPHGLISTDAEFVQQLLVLTTSLSFAAGTSVSWAWLAAGKIKCP